VPSIQINIYDICHFLYAELIILSKVEQKASAIIEIACVHPLYDERYFDFVRKKEAANEPARSQWSQLPNSMRSKHGRPCQDAHNDSFKLLAAHNQNFTR
jgi:hypothetical protein